MARWPRLTAPGIPMHITHRGNNRMHTFLCEHDFAQYRAFLHTASASAGCAIHAYALMTNHVHLLITPQTTTGASQIMQCLGRLYVRYFNARHQRSGTLWEGRFKSALVDSAAYFLTCSRYIDLNPVRAGMVSAPGEYEWSSFAHLGHGIPDPLVTHHAEYLALGRTAPDRRRAYRRWCTITESDHERDAIRRATHEGSALGNAAFQARMAQALGRCVLRAQHGGPRYGVRSADSISMLGMS